MLEVIILGIIVMIALVITVVRQDRHIKELTTKNKKLNELRIQDIHNNTIVLEEDRKIRSILTAVENVTFGNRVDKEKVSKIKELLSHR